MTVRPSENRIPKTGELIQVVAAESFEERPYYNGDIFEVGFSWINSLSSPNGYGGITTTQGIEMFDREFVILDEMPDVPKENPHDEAFATPMGAEFGSDEYEFLHSITTMAQRDAAALSAAWTRSVASTPVTIMTEEPTVEYIRGDKIDHPSHYKQGKFETIEVIEEITQGYEDSYVGYCVGNTIKYLARAPHKHDTPEEDLRKAAKYIEFALARFGSRKSE